MYSAIVVSLVTLAVAFRCLTLAAASQCACATSDANLRSGAGISHPVLRILRTHQCLRHDGLRRDVGSYTWLQLDYHGQLRLWAASNWLDVRECSSINLQLPGCPRIMTRAEWGARAPTHAIGDMPDVPVYVFIHHGASSPCHDLQSCKSKVRGYQNYHIDGHGWWDIGYNFVVGEDGNAYEARGWNEIGAHTKGYNSVGIAICIIGDFSDRRPSAAALFMVRQLIQCGLDNHKISPSYTLKGHRDVGNTSCPGYRLYNLIQTWPHYITGSGLYSSVGSADG